MDLMDACNGGYAFYRYRTGSASSFTATLELAEPALVHSIGITVEAGSTDGYSGIGIYVEVGNSSSTTNDDERRLQAGSDTYSYGSSPDESAATAGNAPDGLLTSGVGDGFVLAYSSEYLYGAYERHASYTTLAPGFVAGEPTWHVLSGVEEPTTKVKLIFGHADQAGDACVSFHSLVVRAGSGAASPPPGKMPPPPPATSDEAPAEASPAPETSADADTDAEAAISASGGHDDSTLAIACAGTVVGVLLLASSAVGVHAWRKRAAAKRGRQGPNGVLQPGGVQLEPVATVTVVESKTAVQAVQVPVQCVV